MCVWRPFIAHCLRNLCSSDFSIFYPNASKPLMASQPQCFPSENVQMFDFLHQKESRCILLWAPQEKRGCFSVSNKNGFGIWQALNKELSELSHWIRENQYLKQSVLPGITLTWNTQWTDLKILNCRIHVGDISNLLYKKKINQGWGNDSVGKSLTI